MQRKGFFKGRVVEVSGSKIIIDTKAETREIKLKDGSIVKMASWDKPDPMPKVGDIVRGRFRVRRR